MHARARARLLLAAIAVVGANSQWRQLCAEAPDICGLPPAPRHSHSSVSVGNAMYIFGGRPGDVVSVVDGEEVGSAELLDDLWRLTFEFDDGDASTTTPKWQHICEQCTQRPEARSGATMAVIEHEMEEVHSVYVVGGERCIDNSLPESCVSHDVWQIDIDAADGAVVREWRELCAEEPCASSKPQRDSIGGMASVGRSLFVFGSSRRSESQNNTVFEYDTTHPVPTWELVCSGVESEACCRPSGCPSARTPSTSVLPVNSGSFYVLGGFGHGDIHTDLWAFDTEQYTWTLLCDQSKADEGLGCGSAADDELRFRAERIDETALSFGGADASSSLFVFGGYNRSIGMPSFDELWELDISASNSRSNAQMKLRCDVERCEPAPRGRQGHTMVSIGDSLVVYGGWEQEAGAVANFGRHPIDELWVFDAEDEGGNVNASTPDVPRSSNSSAVVAATVASALLAAAMCLLVIVVRRRTRWLRHHGKLPSASAEKASERAAAAEYSSSRSDEDTEPSIESTPNLEDADAVEDADGYAKTLASANIVLGDHELPNPELSASESRASAHARVSHLSTTRMPTTTQHLENEDNDAEGLPNPRLSDDRAHQRGEVGSRARKDYQSVSYTDTEPDDYVTDPEYDFEAFSDSEFSDYSDSYSDSGEPRTPPPQHPERHTDDGDVDVDVKETTATNVVEVDVLKAGAGAHAAADSRQAKRLKCPICPRLFTRKCNLITHKREQHSNNVKQFPCTFKDCDKIFYRNHNLKAHLRTHDANVDRNFRCDLCRSHFPQKANFLRHMLHAHERPAKCPFCTERVSSKADFHRHLLAAHPTVDPQGVRLAIRGKKGFMCYCKTTFPSLDDKVAHQINCQATVDARAHVENIRVNEGVLRGAPGGRSHSHALHSVAIANAHHSASPAHAHHPASMAHAHHSASPARAHHPVATAHAHHSASSLAHAHHSASPAHAHHSASPARAHHSASPAHDHHSVSMTHAHHSSVKGPHSSGGASQTSLATRAVGDARISDVGAPRQVSVSTSGLAFTPVPAPRHPLQPHTAPRHPLQPHAAQRHSLQPQAVKLSSLRERIGAAAGTSAGTSAGISTGTSTGILAGTSAGVSRPNVGLNPSNASSPGLMSQSLRFSTTDDTSSYFQPGGMSSESIASSGHSGSFPQYLQRADNALASSSSYAPTGVPSTGYEGSNNMPQGTRDSQQPLASVFIPSLKESSPSSSGDQVGATSQAPPQSTATTGSIGELGIHSPDADAFLSLPTQRLGANVSGAPGMVLPSDTGSSASDSLRLSLPTQSVVAEVPGAPGQNLPTVTKADLEWLQHLKRILGQTERFGQSATIPNTCAAAHDLLSPQTQTHTNEGVLPSARTSGLGQDATVSGTSAAAHDLLPPKTQMHTNEGVLPSARKSGLGQDATISGTSAAADAWLTPQMQTNEGVLPSARARGTGPGHRFPLSDAAVLGLPLRGDVSAQTVAYDPSGMRERRDGDVVVSETFSLGGQSLNGAISSQSYAPRPEHETRSFGATSTSQLQLSALGDAPRLSHDRRIDLAAVATAPSLPIGDGTNRHMSTHIPNPEVFEEQNQPIASATRYSQSPSLTVQIPTIENEGDHTRTSVAAVYSQGRYIYNNGFESQVLDNGQPVTPLPASSFDQATMFVGDLPPMKVEEQT